MGSVSVILVFSGDNVYFLYLPIKKKSISRLPGRHLSVIIWGRSTYSLIFLLCYFRFLMLQQLSISVHSKFCTEFLFLSSCSLFLVNSFYITHVQAGFLFSPLQKKKKKKMVLCINFFRHIQNINHNNI